VKQIAMDLGRTLLWAFVAEEYLLTIPVILQFWA
jgi:hypothetical protein